MKQGTDNNYYLDMQAKMMKDFARMFKCTRRSLKKHFDEAKIAEIYEICEREYSCLIPQIPYIGGKQNSGTYNLVGGAALLAIIRSLEGEGLGNMKLAELYTKPWRHSQLQATPVVPADRKIYAVKLFYKEEKKTNRKISNCVKYPEGFVTRFVEAEGVNHDFGFGYDGVCNLQVL